MNRAIVKKLSSILFLTIFFCKIAISIAPLVAVHFDVKSVKAAITQLEMEDTPKSIDIKGIAIKDYLNVSQYHHFIVDPIFQLDLKCGNFDHDKHVRPFYPPVPTPPPNA
ncbi:hypothetical protein [Desertivirga brevis]|uniref:hypothetical protein n=1 Tax=Desertivirga brevis TaxID=2810310 RepID=UPI001A979465|nr:hypothetical protein [Pedobacter sp. SYSU D00873]